MSFTYLASAGQSQRKFWEFPQRVVVDGKYDSFRIVPDSRERIGRLFSLIPLKND